MPPTRSRLLPLLSLLYLLQGAPLPAEGLLGQVSNGGLPDAPASGGVAPVPAPVLDPQVRYRFVPTPGAEVIQSPYFNLVKDTPDFDNFGNVFLPGGTCFGFTLGIYEQYQRLLYPFMRERRPVYGMDVQTVEGELDQFGIFVVTRDGRRIPKKTAESPFPLRSMRLDPKSAGNRETFELFRLRALTSSQASDLPRGRDPAKTRARIRALFASFSVEQYDRLFKPVEGAAEAATEWKRDLNDPAIGLGIVSFLFPQNGGHAVLAYRCQEGKAIPETAADSAPGFAATAFWLVDPNLNYRTPAVGADDYLLYFHDARRLGFSPHYRDTYRTMPIHSGAFLGPRQIRHHVPPVGEDLWGLARSVRTDIARYPDGDSDPRAVQRLKDLYGSHSHTRDPQSLALALELEVARGTGNTQRAGEDLAFVRTIAPRPDFERLLEAAKDFPGCNDAPCLIDAYQQRSRETPAFPFGENAKEIDELETRLAQEKRGSAIWYATRSRLQFCQQKEEKALAEIDESFARYQFLSRFSPEVEIQDVRTLLGR